MNITITGMVGKRKQKAELEAAARFFANILMDPRMVRNITLDIEIEKDLDVCGECVDEEGTRNPRWFTIRLKRDHDEDIIKTLSTLRICCTSRDLGYVRCCIVLVLRS